MRREKISEMDFGALDREFVEYDFNEKVLTEIVSSVSRLKRTDKTLAYKRLEKESLSQFVSCGAR